MNIDINFTWILLFLIVGIALFLLHNLGGLKIFSKHDNSMINQFLDKFPLVSPDFYKKTQKEQIIENNQEIHEINKRFDETDKHLNDLAECIKKITEIIEELKNNG